MKNYSTFVVLTVMSGILFSSCSRLENISITKRHYRSGFYVDLGAPVPKAKKHDVSKPVPVATAEVTPVSSDVPSTFAVTKNETTQEIATASQPEKKRSHKSHIYASRHLNPEGLKTNEQESIKEQANALTEIKPSGIQSTSETPQWALIVFCILLPPLAVGLKFGIVDKFWISVLLTLLFWLPGVIYALVLILD